MDRRERRTKQRLKIALLTLLREKPFEEIRVMDVVDVGDVVISTFYRHYANKLDLLKEVILSLPDMFDAAYYAQHHPIEKLLQPEFKHHLLLGFQFIATEKVAFRHILTAPYGDLTYQIIFKTFYQRVRETTPEFTEAEATTVSCTLIGNFYHWVLIEDCQNIEQAAERIHLASIYSVILQRPDFADIRTAIQEKLTSEADE